jgi:hypothetical protein
LLVSDAHASFDAGALGTLKLDQSSEFGGTIARFAGGDALDLAFGSNATLGYAANAAGTGGTLTVSVGAHTANLSLLGQYAAAGFTTAADQAAAPSSPMRRRRAAAAIRLYSPIRRIRLGLRVGTIAVAVVAVLLALAWRQGGKRAAPSKCAAAKRS